MPSFTFNSNANDRVPAAPLGLFWLCAVLVTSVFVITVEIAGRTLGFVPAPRDDHRLWSVHRSRATEGGHEAVVILGSSRAMSDINLRIFARAGNCRTPVQLGIVGVSPVPFLRDLADDSTFCGTVLLCIDPCHVFVEQKAYEDIAEERLRRFREYQTSPANWCEYPLSTLVDSAFVCRRIELNFRTVLSHYLLRGILPSPGALSTDLQRQWLLDRSTDIRRPFTYRAPHPLSSEQLHTQIGDIVGSIRRIQARNGQVLVLRLPTTGSDNVAAGVEDTEKEQFPREGYWDIFVKSADVPAWHCEDFPDLDFHGVDGSHLDRHAAEEFSRRLGHMLHSYLRRSGDGPNATRRLEEESFSANGA